MAADSWHTRDVFDWSVADVGQWVAHIGLAERSACFVENCISGLALTELDNDDLRALGLTKVGERKTFLRAMRRLTETKSEDSGARSHPSSHSSESASKDSWDTDSSSHSTGSRGSRGSRGSGKPTVRKWTNHTVKAYLRDKAKVFEMPKDSSFSELRSQLRKSFGKRVSVSWKRANGDKIRMKRDRDWSACKKECGERIRLYCTPHTDAETASKQNEMRALATLADPVVVIDAGGRILMFNNAAETFFGYKASAVLGSKVNILMPDEEAAQHDQYLRNYIETGVKKVMGRGRKVTALKRNGDKVPVFLSLSETSSRKRNERQFIGTLQDLSGGQTEDTIIKEDQSASFTILQNILDAAIVINQHGIVKFFNAAAEDFFGYRAQAVVGRNVSMLMQGKDKREHNTYLANYFKTGKATVIGRGREVIAALADGTLKAVHLSVTEQKFGSNSLFTGILRPVVDEPEEVESTRTLSILEQTRDTLDNLLVAAVVSDDTGKILAFNESAEELFGYKLINVIGKNVKMLCPPEHAVNHDSYLQRWRETGEEHVFGIGRDLTARTASGAIIPIRLSVTKRKDESGRFLVTALFQKLKEPAS